MKFFCLMCSLVASASVLAVPTVGNVEIAQGADRVVNISYDLTGGPAIVTFDVFTNGVYVGDRAFERSWGDVNVLVTNETGRFNIKWLLPEDFPEDTIAGGGVSADVRAWSPDSPPDYAVFDMLCKRTVNFYASVGRIPGGIENDVYRKEKLAMRKIPAAGVRWQMGAPSWQKGIVATNETQRWVTLSEDYYIAVFEFTQGQYLNLLKGVTSSVSISPDSQASCNPNYDSDLCPLSWTKRTDFRGSAANGYAWPGNGHAVSSGSPLGALRTSTGYDFDLPTQAQWEYACRAGQSAALYNGRELHDSSTSTTTVDGSLTNIVWYGGHRLDGLAKKAPVGMLRPNAWGLYDMLGNVWEYVLDRQGGTRPSSTVTDPTGPLSGSQYMHTSGSFFTAPNSVRCAFSRAI